MNSMLVILGIAIAMGMDVFSVSMAVAAGPRSPRQAFRLAWHFGLFQFFMPLIGWIVGHTVADVVGAYDHWIAFGLLGLIGGHMLLEGIGHDEEKPSTLDRSKGWRLVALSVATSIDALGVGLTFGVLGSRIWLPAFVIGIVSGAMSLVGTFIGRRMRAHFGGRMEILGGLVLIGLGIKFVIQG
jgi:putative Mn2+ efflux pump MntP